MYAPPDHPVFVLVPPLFHDRATTLYASMGEPVLSSDTFWNVYRQLLHAFDERRESDELMSILSIHANEMAQFDHEADKMELIPDLKPFRNGRKILGSQQCIHKYIGGLGDPPTGGLRGEFRGTQTVTGSGSEDDVDGAKPERAYFTTDEEDSEDE